jgi:hypothetical protein
VKFIRSVSCAGYLIGCPEPCILITKKMDVFLKPMHIGLRQWVCITNVCILMVEHIQHTGTFSNVLPTQTNNVLDALNNALLKQCTNLLKGIYKRHHRHVLQSVYVTAMIVICVLVKHKKRLKYQIVQINKKGVNCMATLRISALGGLSHYSNPFPLRSTPRVSAHLLFPSGLPLGR